MIKVPSETEFDLFVHDDLSAGALLLVYADRAEGRPGIAVRPGSEAMRGPVASCAERC